MASRVEWQGDGTVAGPDGGRQAPRQTEGGERPAGSLNCLFGQRRAHAVSDNWPEIRRRMQEEHRTSTKAVSAFFLLPSADRIPLLTAKLATLQRYGITAEQVQAVADLASELFLRYTPADNFQEEVPDLWCQVAGKRCY